jgi:hypothetical protein
MLSSQFVKFQSLVVANDNEIPQRRSSYAFAREASRALRALSVYVCDLVRRKYIRAYPF